MTQLPRCACAALVLCAGAILPWAAGASECGDAIAKLETSLDAEGREAGAATGAGQAAAAARSSKAIEARKTDTPVGDLPKPPMPGDKAGTEKAEAAGTAGEDVMAAKVSLNDARNADKKGDEAACRAALDKARGQARR